SGASSVVLVPARPGTGVTAGKSVRPCLELAGITDILTKAYGSTSPKNLVKATLAALHQLQNREQVEQTRGVTLEKGAGVRVTAEGRTLCSPWSAGNRRANTRFASTKRRANTRFAPTNRRANTRFAPTRRVNTRFTPTL